jgi:hypothetical protein
LSAYSESAELTLKSAKPTPACPESARPTSKSARLIAPTAIVPVSAQVGLADSQSAKPTFPVPAATKVSLDGSTPLVDWFLGMKSNIMQIKDMHFSNMINRVENTNILLKF